MENLKSKTISGFIYKFLERVGASGIQLFVSILLARLLLPNEYGIIAIVSIVIALLDVFVTYGFGNSLVADKNSDDVDFSTCFYFGLFLSIAIYCLIFFLAPVISEWFSWDSKLARFKYDVDLLTNVFRVMALRLPIAAINSVQHAFVQKKMLFKKFFYSTLIGTLVSGCIAVIMAYLSFGVWALVVQYLGNIFIDTIVLFITVEWKPVIKFSLVKLKKIYSYGWKILVVGLIDVGYSQLKSIVIAKKYSSEDLAFYNKGNEFPSTCNNFIEPTISTVLFPALAQTKDSLDEMRTITRRCIQISTYIIFPIMFGLTCVADPLVRIILTDKWENSILFLQIFCIAYLFRPIQFINNCVVRACGKSGLLLILDVIKKTVGIVLIIAGMFYGPIGIALSFVVTNFISTLINILPNKKLLNYGYWDQFKDILGSFILGFFMSLIVYSLSYVISNSILLLITQIVAGVSLYLGLSIITKNESFFYLYKTLKNYLCRREQ